MVKIYGMCKDGFEYPAPNIILEPDFVQLNFCCSLKMIATADGQQQLMS